MAYFIKLLSRKEEARDRKIKLKEQIYQLTNPAKTKECFSLASHREPEKKSNAIKQIKSSELLLQKYPIFEEMRSDDGDLEPVDLLQQKF